MGLVILEKKEPIKKLKCTLQKSGRLAFPEFTSKSEFIIIYNSLAWSVENWKYFPKLIPKYFDVNSDFDDKKSYKIYKSGLYYYVLANFIFIRLGYKSDDSSIIFD